MAENGKLLTFTDENFATEVEGSEGLVLIDFWAAWCGPCRIIAPIVEQLATEYDGKARVGKLDVDSNPRMTSKYNVRSIPAVLFFKDGKLVDTVVGAVPRPALQRALEAHL